MASKANLTKVANIDASVREIDFVTRFGKNWEALRQILGIMRPIRKAPGTKLVSYTAKVTLQPGNVGEGEEIPYSLAEVDPVAYDDLTLEKYAKAVSIEAVNKYGAAIAVQKTDDAFLNELTGNVLDRFYTFLQTGTLTDTETSFQMAVAMSVGLVRNKFKTLRRDVTKVVTFVNTIDAYKYLGAASLSVQDLFGIQYVEDFMGATLIITSEIPQGKVISTPVDNIDLYYVDPADSEFAQLGLNYTVEGETNLIGFHVNGNYNTAVGEVFALMGLTLWAEYLDGISVVTVDANPLKGLTVQAESGATTIFGTSVADMQSDLVVSGNAISGTLKYIDSGTLATDWGPGYFMALKFSGTDASATSVKVGLRPSVSSGLVELINDPDQNGVFKVTDKDRQDFVVISSATGHQTTQSFSLKGLTLTRE